MEGLKKFSKDLLSTEKLLRYSKGHRFIFSYHDIGVPGTAHHSPRNATHPALFMEQIALIDRLFRVVTLNEIVSGRDLGRGNFAAITFDDGFRSVYTHARPVLKNAGLPYAVFINGAAVVHGENWISNMERHNDDGTYIREVLFAAGMEREDRTDPIDRIIERGRFGSSFFSAYGRPRPGGRIYLDHAELKELVGEGVVLGDHTWDHVVLGATEGKVLEEQLARGSELLHDLTGSKSVHHAIPFGKKQHFDAGSVKALRTHGFKHVYTTNPNRFVKRELSDADLLIPRIGVVDQTARELLFYINRTLLRRYDL
ncbi:MAG: polysaccharide deacetylase family protein [Flavobacteriales bacterium]|jgi:peptidoglycan/xylan/chitin deacetylase (PgdA/CDA1 family)|nr:polysaccharide deacetylase family protein [Flavobacteriales bacterium]MBK6753373.1 polysaccharide deacetylase family protein [Flavobacteriales bacterium]MBK7086952.1 polysaccharide deacetylase family protein [Flavobacteriales bacterium]MBK7753343.1 polysaccharide deacetylase family protein [Flavobacteriales bacterium]MBK9077226.1 polysaccharide deacetylase family protein [Flavobacteriales bacterium]